MENILVGLVGSLIAFDTTAAFQLLISQPLIACTILGWILGDAQLGLLVGFYLQLLWLSSLPVGAAVVPEGNVAAIVTSALVLRFAPETQGFYTLLVLAVLYGLLISYFGGKAVVLDRKMNKHFMEKFQHSVEQGNLRLLGRSQLMAIGFHFVIMFTLVFIAMVLGDLLFSRLILLPDHWDPYFKKGAISILGIGIGLAYPLFRDKPYRWFILGGLIAGLVLFFVISQ